MPDMWTCFHNPPGRGPQQPIIRGVSLELAKLTVRTVMAEAHAEARGDWELAGETWILRTSTGAYSIEPADQPQSGAPESS